MAERDQPGVVPVDRVLQGAAQRLAAQLAGQLQGERFILRSGGLLSQLHRQPQLLLGGAHGYEVRGSRSREIPSPLANWSIHTSPVNHSAGPFIDACLG